MQFRSRDQQKAPNSNVGHFALATATIFDDTIFDTEPLSRPTRALNWVLETSVHQALKLTDRLKNANQFVGVQRAAVRDEVRETTYVAAIQDDGLYLYTLKNGKIYSTTCIDPSPSVRRCHLSLRKFDGTPLVLYARDDGTLYLNDKQVDTPQSDVDFPYLTIDQPPIGFPAVVQPTIGFIAYKSRASGDVVVRPLDPMALATGAETTLPIADVVGGADLVIAKDRVIVRSQTRDGQLLKSAYLESTDGGKTFGQPHLFDLSGISFENEIPSNAPMTLDYTLQIHVPIAVKNGSVTRLLDVILDDDLVVSAIEAPAGFNFAVDAFPKMPAITQAFRTGFGDGHLDGSGIIASLAHQGRLLVSNSQSGGYSFPDAVHLNYDMQGVYGFRSTECYTRGSASNIVSMDYAFVEADNDGRPLSSEFWIDTWDMPLPEPQVTCALDASSATLEILKDGWFFPGQTAFELTPANTFITSVNYVGFRTARLEFDDFSLAKGATITFRTKNVFFYYEASAKLT
ncbi:hypothetical protein FJ527_04785 [Mesorhizobium sp. B2-4-18]|uniref:hypothetical protein n=1 Tax=Mesorhizobium sp. B2-4-18 TaxID=2589931 RepID=UPI001126C5A0|nr:hypothetical protein [Mesorhizobium sp. B2-4-18]TPK79438.1 hypothetical protein FJ527_04785 [Mesorhizobium sp. B2-4-18]